MELLDITPQELMFTVEVKKQCTCTVQLVNKSDQYVAFKVKTTSPKKYCVRPNAGVVEPKGVCEFAVTMQAPRSLPTDLHCKDKFLVQSTVVPCGTSEESIGSDMFSKGVGNFVEETKLKVVLVCPVEPPTSLADNLDINQDPSFGYTRELDKAPRRTESTSPGKDMEEVKTADVAKDMRFTHYQSADDSITVANNFDSTVVENGFDLKLPKEVLHRQEVQELTLKIDVLKLKLAEAEQTILKLTEERSKAKRDRDSIEQELALVARHIRSKTVYVGFPLLYVCMVALISMTFGYLMNVLVDGVPVLADDNRGKWWLQ
ncbi:Vesicle-associated protein 2-2-like protein [Drosera capensis]